VLSFTLVYLKNKKKNGPAGATQTFSPDWTERRAKVVNVRNPYRLFDCDRAQAAQQHESSADSYFIRLFSSVKQKHFHDRCVFFWRNTAAPPRFVTRLKMLWR
jgi:hypothetical protein